MYLKLYQRPNNWEWIVSFCIKDGVHEQWFKNQGITERDASEKEAFDEAVEAFHVLLKQASQHIELKMMVYIDYNEIPSKVIQKKLLSNWMIE